MICLDLAVWNGPTASQKFSPTRRVREKPKRGGDGGYAERTGATGAKK